jgi:hypothetical protein
MEVNLNFDSKLSSTLNSNLTNNTSSNTTTNGVITIKRSKLEKISKSILKY